MDEPTQILTMHRTEPKCIQSLALQLAAKVFSHVENNERILDIKQGISFGQKSGRPRAGVLCLICFVWRCRRVETEWSVL